MQSPFSDTRRGVDRGGPQCQEIVGRPARAARRIIEWQREQAQRLRQKMEELEVDIQLWEGRAQRLEMERLEMERQAGGEENGPQETTASKTLENDHD